MGKSLGQYMIIENIGGAGGTLGTGRVPPAYADAWTVFQSRYRAAFWRPHDQRLDLATRQCPLVLRLPPGASGPKRAEVKTPNYGLSSSLAARTAAAQCFVVKRNRLANPTLARIG